MTMDTVQLQRRLLARFPDVKQVSPSAFMYSRSAGGVPFAVVYFDLAHSLPRSPKELSDYQSHLVGERYFSGRPSLQWSQYLYFVTSQTLLNSAEGAQAKRLIEEDTEYARKFVIAEEEVDSVIAPKAVETPRAISTNIVSKWAERLAAAGIERAVLDEMSLPDRLNIVETGVGRQRQRRADLSHAPSSARRFLSSLRLERYRSYPRDREFQFGTVNLIHGANATGKTSLLEAIELFFCGKNRRNPKVGQAYRLTARFSDGVSESVDENRRLQELRDRSLAWYGQMEVNRADLFASFGQFNFLDTDAAVGLAEAKADIEDQLSRLLVGSDASRVWRNIERLSDRLAEELRALRRVDEEKRRELEGLEADLRAVGDVPHESDAIVGGLKIMLARQGWPELDDTGERLATRLLGELPELLAVASQAAEHQWAGAPVTLKALAQYAQAGALLLQSAKGRQDELEHLKEVHARAVFQAERSRESLALAQEAVCLLKNGVLARNEARNAVRQEIANLALRLAGADDIWANRASLAFPDMTLSGWIQESVEVRDRTRAAAEEAHLEWKRMMTLQDRSLKILEELRQLGRQIVRNDPTSQECPLCHTLLGPGELAQRLEKDTAASFGPATAALATQVEIKTRMADEAETRARTAAWLARFCGTYDTGGDVPVAVAMANVHSAMERRHWLEGQLQALEEEGRALQLQGISAARLDVVEARLRDLGHPLQGHAPADAESLAAFLQTTFERMSADVQASAQEVVEAESRLASMFSRHADASLAGREVATAVAQRVAAATVAIERLAGYGSRYPWPSTGPLTTLALEARSILEVASRLNEALGREQQSTGLRKHLSGRIDELRSSLQHPGTRARRFSEAHDLIDHLRREEPLSAAMGATLRELRSSVEQIFGRIHSPAEFSGLGAEWTSLLRRSDGSEAQLSQISTGQRSALALAIFLAQNAQLTSAPPVLLIDDPIAHTDDLNALAFLDYLREVALAGQRQIFFATASRKLASLFEKKFDFLGSQFRRIALERRTGDSVGL